MGTRPGPGPGERHVPGLRRPLRGRPERPELQWLRGNGGALTCGCTARRGRTAPGPGRIGLDEKIELDPGLTVAVPDVVPRRLRAHAFAALVLAGILVGGGLRFLPTSTASAAGAGGASTACTAK